VWSCRWWWWSDLQARSCYPPTSSRGTSRPALNAMLMMRWWGCHGPDLRASNMGFDLIMKNGILMDFIWEK
jgi:hypothetical protein